jgi:tungstate transport system ATP-binding protein
MGQNGAGKSTLLKIIAGLELEFEGIVLYDLKPLNKDIYSKMTMVFQTPHLFKKTVF